ncbi:hypothetical protein MGH68_00785 [Erysipelothrix sp. D19-032]
MIGQYYRAKDFADEIVVVSPDHGGATRARKLSIQFLIQRLRLSINVVQNQTLRKQ